MNDLDDRVREELRVLAEPVRSRIEVAAVVEAGARRRRARRAAWASAGTAAVAGVVASVLLARGPAESIVGTPAPATPAPIQTFTIAPSFHEFTPPPSGAFPRVWSTTTKLSDVVDGDLGFDAVRVTGRESGNEVAVEGVRKDTVVTRSEEISAGSSMVTKLNDKVWVIVSRGDVQFVQGAVAGGGLSGGTNYSHGDLEVFIVTGEQQRALAGYLWVGSDGTAHDDAGARMPSGRVEVGGRTFWFARAVDLRIACGGAGTAGSGESVECGGLSGQDVSARSNDLEQAGGGSRSGNNSEDVRFLVLPEGASDWSAESVDGCAVAGSNLDPSGRVLLVSLCTGFGEDGAAKHPAIHYRTASGTLVTYR